MIPQAHTIITRITTGYTRLPFPVTTVVHKLTCSSVIIIMKQQKKDMKVKVCEAYMYCSAGYGQQGQLFLIETLGKVGPGRRVTLLPVHKVSNMKLVMTSRHN